MHRRHIVEARRQHSIETHHPHKVETCRVRVSTLCGRSVAKVRCTKNELLKFEVVY